MLGRYAWENLYKTQLTSKMTPVSLTGDPLDVFTFDVTTAPVNTQWWAIIEFTDEQRRDLIFFHDVVWTTISYYRKDRDLLGIGARDKTHKKKSFVQINDVRQWMSHLYRNVDDFWFVQDRGDDNIRVHWGKVFYKGAYADITDVTLSGLWDGTRFICFDYDDGTFKWLASTATLVGQILASVTIASGDITVLTDLRWVNAHLHIDTSVFARWSDGELKLVAWPTVSAATEASNGTVELWALSEHGTTPVWQQVVQVKNTVQTPDGTPANDAKKVPVLNSDGFIDDFVSFSEANIQAWDAVHWTDAWGDDTYVVVLDPVLAAYTIWQRLRATVSTANTGACTIDFWPWAKSIKTKNWNDPADWDVRVWANDFVYDGTNFVLQWFLEEYSDIVGDYQYIFGDGSDGDVTISSNVTLTRDMYYNNLTINATRVLSPDGYKIYVKWTLTNNGIIRRNWNNWSNWWNGASWVPWAAWSWAVALNTWTLEDSVAWGDWAIGISANWQGNTWSAWTSTNPSYTNTNGVAWGNGGDANNGGANVSGWAWGTSTRWSDYDKVYSLVRLLSILSNPASGSVSQLTTLLSDTLYEWPWSAWWWASGDSEWSQASWGGWGGWWAWGVIWIAAKVFDNQWTIESIWWDGGDGGSPYTWWSWDVGWSGWWGGGNGGIIYLIYRTLTSLGTTTLTWWSGWALSAWSGWAGDDGTAWSNGNTWEVIQISI